MVEGGGRLTENFVGLLTHIEEQGSLQLDPPPLGVLKFAKICTVVARIGAPWCVAHLVRHALKHSKTQRRELPTFLARLQFPPPPPFSIFGSSNFLLFPASRLLHSLCIFFNKRPSSLAPRAFGHAGWIMQKLLCRILPT